MGIQMGAAHQKAQTMIRSLEFSVLLFHSLERGERLEMESIINHAYIMKVQ